ncbi:Thermostable monoacylglycerol lipase [Pseudoruegeria aquimaris]|uniref:Thermostable monoacylglycerol lipase n=1 Tax=Pseudoruegeria aquimaris TaxID=393663 RepID=A0A1Y5RGY9_9RHOB|nr:alpha/beta fold hydrolase [Pseudoruegeria aquimaris]SLN17110.1 Thermostable monoacylglycerol lipase [Pseudoruegeria aquimaris]
MRRLGKWIGRGLLLVVIVVGLLVAFGPYEPLHEDVRFDAAQLEGGVDAYLAAQEAGFEDLTPGVAKRVHWAGEVGARTPLALVYVHGFSATSEEIRPVPDRLAEALGANLHFTRLSGHGRGGAAMAEPRVQDWMEDMAEAVAVGRAIGDEVILITTSTGGTFAALAALEPALVEDVAGIVFVSPNFGINNPLAPLLTWPAARHWVGLVGGAERAFEPQNEGHGTYWTTRYPTVSVLPMAAAVKHAASQDYGSVSIPALFVFSDEDRVVRPDITREIAARWGGPVKIVNMDGGEGGDPFHHVIAGDILSPAGTQPAVEAIGAWIESLQ